MNAKIFENSYTSARISGYLKRLDSDIDCKVICCNIIYAAASVYMYINR